MTNGKMADVKTAKKNIKIVPDSIYTFDKGYYDLNWFRQIDEAGAFFVTRIKNNARFEVAGQHRPALPKKGVISDTNASNIQGPPRSKNTQANSGSSNSWTTREKHINS